MRSTLRNRWNALTTADSDVAPRRVSVSLRIFPGQTALRRLVEVRLPDDPRADQDVPRHGAVFVEEGRVVLDLALLPLRDLPETPVLLQEDVLLQGKAHGEAKVLVVPRLGDELVDRPFVHRSEDRLDVRVAGEHDPDRFRPPLLDLAKELRPGHPRHPVVRDDEVDLLLLEDPDGVLRGPGDADLVVLLEEDAAQGVENRLLVVHEQEGESLRPLHPGLSSRGGGRRRDLRALEQVSVSGHDSLSGSAVAARTSPPRRGYPPPRSFPRAR
jgi:hypothetical protein